MKTAVIICGGSISDDEYASNIIANGDYLIAVDSGADHLIRMNLIPDLLIGDFDSISEMSLKMFSNVDKMSFPPEKDMTDTELALREAINRGFSYLTILGGTGSRVDHMLANISMLELVDQLGSIAIIEDSIQTILLLTPSNAVFEKRLNEDTIISLLPITESVTGVQATGVKFPLHQATLSRASSLGVSNETKEDVVVSIKEGKLLIVITYKEV